MKTGLVGLPGSGVTSLFSLFCRRTYEDAAFSGKTDIHYGVVNVPDRRVEELTEVFQSKKTVYATIEFADIPMQTENSILSPLTVSHIRQMDAVILVLRSFTNSAVPHFSGSIDPVRDLHLLLSEALLIDLVQVENRLERIEKEGRIKDREGQFFSELKARLDESVPIRNMDFGSDCTKEISGFRFLTEKLWLVVINCDPGDEVPASLADSLHANRLSGLPVPVQFEMDLEEFSDTERLEFLQDIGLDQTGRDRFINLVYRELDLISFFTHGNNECRAWSLKRGSTALDAAQKIHSDMARGFIRAEVIHYDMFMQCGGTLHAVKKTGKMRVEGKNYIVRDGDIITVLFNI